MLSEEDAPPGGATRTKVATVVELASTSVGRLLHRWPEQQGQLLWLANAPKPLEDCAAAAPNPVVAWVDAAPKPVDACVAAAPKPVDACVAAAPKPPLAAAPNPLL